MRRILLLSILFVPSTLVAQTADEKKATIKFLSDLQQPDGGFIAAPLDPKSDTRPKSSLRATSAALRAIKYLGGELSNRPKTIQFVKSCFDRPKGLFADQPGSKADVSTTAVGIMAAAELFSDEFDPTRSVDYLVRNSKTFEERRLAVAGMESAMSFPDGINEWFTQIQKSANSTGTFGNGDGEARETGGVAAMFLRASRKLPDDQRKNIVAALQKGQQPDGGYGKAGEKSSDGETTYRVMRAFHLLGEMPKDVAKLKNFQAKCRNADGGYGVSPGQPSTVSGTYYVAAIGQWLEK
jgi:prenyltransferase beta subunit